MTAQPGADDHRLGRAVLVPVVNPASLSPLLACATALAASDDGVVDVLTVASSRVDREQRRTIDRRLALAHDLAGPVGVELRTSVEVHDDIPSGVLAAAARTQPSIVLIGWSGRSSTSDVCGRLIDRIVGRARVPLGVMRPGHRPPNHGLLPLTFDHTLPGGTGGLALATDVAWRLRQRLLASLTVLATGTRPVDVPNTMTAIADRIERDERRNHTVVAQYATAEHFVISPVAPTAVGLRAATTHLAWATPAATLLATIDPGPAISAAVDAAH